MKLDIVSSERLNVIRFPLIVGVVFIHAYKSTEILSGVEMGLSHTSPATNFVRSLISEGIATVAVPLLFLISGYLFFLGFEWSLAGYVAKLNSRVRTLFVPLLIWDALILAVTALAEWFPATRAFLSGNNAPVSSFGVIDTLHALIGLDQDPICYQFWFIRDLIVLALFAPLIHVIHRTAPLSCLLVISCLWFAGVWPICVPSAAAVLFFYLGSFVAVKGINLFRSVDRYGRQIALSYLVVVAGDTLTKVHDFGPYVHKFGILLGILAALYLTRYLANSSKVNACSLCFSSSFFLFAVHEPMLRIARRIAYKLLVPHSSWMILMLYFAIPCLVIVVSLLGYYVLLAKAPRLLKVLTGGRCLALKPIRPD